MKNIRVVYLKLFSFLEVKFSIYSNRRVFVMPNRLYGPCQEKTYLRAYADSEGPGQPVNPHSLIKAFILR